MLLFHADTSGKQPKEQASRSPLKGRAELVKQLSATTKKRNA
jgi:hypothetical protein